MAKIRSGILGNLRGKVSGVVGSQWKDVNYVREYVKPANPNTAAQQLQRGLMAACVAFAKPLVGPVFNTFTDQFIKSMSGFNFFIKKNIALFDETPDYPAVKVTEGKLSPISGLGVTYADGTGVTVLTWDENLGNNGLGDDKLSWGLYDKSTGIWYFSDGPVNRDSEIDQQTIITGLTATNLQFYCYVGQLVAARLTLISNSVHVVCTAP